MTISLPPWLIRAVQVSVLLGLLALLWRAADGRAALAALAQANPAWLGAAALALTLQTALSAQRWRITARQLGLHIAPAAALREYYLAQVVNQALPGGVIGDAGRAVRARGPAGLMISGQAVLFERIAGQLGLLVALLAGLVALSLGLDAGLWPLWMLAAGAALLAASAALCFCSQPDTPTGRGVHAFQQAVFGRAVLGQQIALSLGTAICNIAAFVFCAMALGVGLPALAVAAIVPLILFAMILPLSISGWGLREGAAAVVVPVIGGTASQGLATSVAFGLVFLAIVLPGALVPLISKYTPPPKRGAVPQMRGNRSS